MEFYYLCERQVWEENIHLFSESHFLETPTPGIILVCATFGNKAHEDLWRCKKGVEALPHALRPQVISLRHAGLLERMGVTIHHTTMDVAEQVAKTHSGFRFSGI